MKLTPTTPSPSTETDIEEDDMEEEEEAVEEEDIEEDEDDEEDEEAAPTTVKDSEEYEYPIDSDTYQASDYLESFYNEKNSQGAKTPTQQPQPHGDGERLILHAIIYSLK